MYSRHETFRVIRKLRSYCVKIYASLPFVGVKLNENDVPGAKLGNFELEKHGVAQIKHWLTCRKQPITAKKVDRMNSFVG